MMYMYVGDSIPQALGTQELVMLVAELNAYR